jgi:hypothetical protein
MPHARTTDPITSHLAADSISNGEVSKTQKLIISLLVNGPRADFEIVQMFQDLYPAIASDSGIRTRRAELVSKGVVVDTGFKVKMPHSNRLAIVWGLNA